MSLENIAMICVIIFFSLGALVMLAFLATYAISEVLELIDSIKKRSKKVTNHD